MNLTRHHLRTSPLFVEILTAKGESTEASEYRPRVCQRNPARAVPD